MLRTNHATQYASIFVALLTAAVLLLGSLQLANVTRTRYFFFHSSLPFFAEIFGARTDFNLWLAALSLLSLMPYLALYLNRKLHPAHLIPSLGAPIAIAYVTLGLAHGYLVLSLAGYVLMATFLFRSRALLGIRRSKLTSYILLAFGCLLIPIQIASIAVWTQYPYTPGYPFDGDPKWALPKLSMQVFNLAYHSTPYLLVALLTAWLWTPMVCRRLEGESWKEPRFRTPLIIGPLLLLASAIFAGFLSYYPYLHLKQPVGADTRYYLELLSFMAALENVGGHSLVFQNIVLRNEPHVPYILILYGIQSYAHVSGFDAIKMGQIILAVLSVVSTYVLAWEATRSHPIAGLSSLLIILSPTFTVGMFYAIFTNWLALSEVAVFFTFVLRYVRHKSVWNLFIAALLSVLIGYTHPWTSATVISTLTLFTLILALRRLARRAIVGLTVLLALNLILGLFFLLGLPPMPRSDPGASYLAILRHVSLSNVTGFIPNLEATLGRWAGSFFSNPLMIFLAVVGVVSLVGQDKDLGYLLLAWTATVFVGLLAFTPIFQWRLLYFLPLSIPAAVGVIEVIDRIRNQLYVGDRDRRLYLASSLSFLALVLLALLDNALRSVAHISF